jgi:hypothetical protein
VIKDWLWLKKDREGGRKKRELEKKKKKSKTMQLKMEMTMTMKVTLFKTLFCQQCNYFWYSTSNNITLV